MAQVFNRTKSLKLTDKARVCRAFWEKALGFMFRRSLKPDEVLIFVNGKESRWNSGIHMLFVFTPIAVVWLSKDKKVVDKTLALPFRPWYFPSRPAQYFLEGPSSLLEKVEVGDELGLEGL